MSIRGAAPIHALLYFLGLDDALTQTTENERNCLARFAKNRKLALEIGVWEGISTRVLRRHMDRDGILYAVDPFYVGKLGVCWSRPIAVREAKRDPQGARVIFVRALSHDAAKTLRARFDFAFIDGDHSFEGIRQDWADWSDRVVPGGIICLHDTTLQPNSPLVLGSHQYFESHIRTDPRFRLVAQVDSLSVMQRI
jgi:predicted O-methyltransferase YrrM